MAELETKPPEQENSGGLHIPMWVALAGLLLSLILAAVIMRNIISPIADLIFPASVDIPLPDGAKEIEHLKESKTAEEEWLYQVEGDACEISWFYQGEARSCQYSPGMCQMDEEQDKPILINPAPDALVAKCTGGESTEVTGYSWEVMVSTGSTGEETYFRVFLYE